MSAFLRDLLFGDGAAEDPEAGSNNSASERRGLMTLNDLVQMQDNPQEKKEGAPTPAPTPQPRPLAKEDMVILKRDLLPEETGAFAVEDNLALSELANKSNLVLNMFGTGMAVALFVLFA
jgi:hypothetical protein